MPIKTGIEALKEIRSSGDRTHVIMLTAMAEIDDRVTGLDGWGRRLLDQANLP